VVRTGMLPNTFGNFGRFFLCKCVSWDVIPTIVLTVVFSFPRHLTKRRPIARSSPPRTQPFTDHRCHRWWIFWLHFLKKTSNRNKLPETNQQQSTTFFNSSASSLFQPCLHPHPKICYFKRVTAALPGPTQDHKGPLFKTSVTSLLVVSTFFQM